MSIKRLGKPLPEKTKEKLRKPQKNKENYKGAKSISHKEKLQIILGERNRSEKMKEITKKCNGVLDLNGIRKPCSFCYKSNGPSGKNMSLKDFKIVIDKMPWLTQLAIGADSQGISNPDMIPMMEYARSKGIIPNLTIADVSDDIAVKLSKLCGACAISRYENKNICYDSVKKLTDLGMKQVNIHQILHNQNIKEVYETIDDIKNDKRLEKLNAIVYFSLKQKGRGEKFNPISQEEFSKIINKSFELGINFGCDSCSHLKMTNSIKNREDYKQIEKSIEPCESFLMSSFCNVDAKFFPCSFAENIKEWEKGLDIIKCDDFIKNIWNNKKSLIWRNKLLKNKRCCPIYNI